MARLVDLGVVTYLWIPGVAGITSETAPSIATLNGASAKNISSQVVTTTDLGVQASDTVNERSVTDVTNAVVPTVGNYGGNLVLFRDFASGVPAATDPLTVIGKAVGTTGWIVKRLGKAASAPFAVGDLVSCYLVMIDNPTLTGGQGDGYLKATYPVLQQGRFSVEAACVA